MIFPNPLHRQVFAGYMAGRIAPSGQPGCGSVLKPRPGNWRISWDRCWVARLQPPPNGESFPIGPRLPAPDGEQYFPRRVEQLGQCHSFIHSRSSGGVGEK